MNKYIFRKDWHKLSADQIRNIITKEFTGLTEPTPSAELIAALAHQGICSLQVLEDREQSTFYRIWQTDQIFIRSSIGYPPTLADTAAYLALERRDFLISVYNKKIPVFVGQRINGTSAIIKHTGEPLFYCHYEGVSLHSTAYPGVEPSRQLVDKCNAFYNSYFKPLAD
jgi:hypothetical protein